MVMVLHHVIMLIHRFFPGSLLNFEGLSTSDGSAGSSQKIRIRRHQTWFLDYNKISVSLLAAFVGVVRQLFTYLFRCVDLPRQERDALNQFRKHTFEEWLSLFIRVGAILSFSKPSHQLTYVTYFFSSMPSMPHATECTPWQTKSSVTFLTPTLS